MRKNEMGIGDIIVESLTIFGMILYLGLQMFPELSRKHTVYALDTRGHGESASPEQYHYSDMAEDIAAFVHALDLTKPAFYGFYGFHHFRVLK